MTTLKPIFLMRPGAMLTVASAGLKFVTPGALARGVTVCALSAWDAIVALKTEFIATNTDDDALTARFTACRRIRPVIVSECCISQNHSLKNANSSLTP
jgi:hypothetical protein